MGFPFFTPIYIPGTKLTYYGPVTYEEDSLERIIGDQLTYRYFPVRHSELAASIKYTPLKECTMDLGDGITLKTKYLNHPVLCLGYRFEYEGKSICTAYDTEPFRNVFPPTPPHPITINSPPRKGKKPPGKKMKNSWPSSKMPIFSFMTVSIRIKNILRVNSAGDIHRSSMRSILHTGPGLKNSFSFTTILSVPIRISTACFPATGNLPGEKPGCSSNLPVKGWKLNSEFSPGTTVNPDCPFSHLLVHFSCFRGISSVGRAIGSQSIGQGFESPILHPCIPQVLYDKTPA